MRPSIPSTVIDAPSTRTACAARCLLNAWPAIPIHHTMAATRASGQPGSAASSNNVAAAASAMKHEAARDGTRVKSQVMSEIVADLSSNALLFVSGDDASAFLHAQLTNDVEALGVNRAQWNGWCSPKGRLLATFLLVRRPDGFLAMLPGEIAAPIAKRLAMFVLRSKVKIADVSDRYARRGILGHRAGPAPMEVSEDNGAILVGLEPGRIVAFMPPERALTPNVSPDAWELAAIRAGVPIITAATQEAFVPQMANFELVGGVSFKKGCYPGQEIVARMQYRGGLKRRMALAHVGGSQRPQPGESVYSATFGDQAAGTIVNAAPVPEGGFDALVVAQIESLQRGDLRWKSPDGPGLEVRSHPPLAA